MFATPLHLSIRRHILSTLLLGAKKFAPQICRIWGALFIDFLSSAAQKQSYLRTGKKQSR